ncbi:hypothetical protein AMTR_s00001p00205350 [Amborella trichopoda]|uniref:Uncharacterized protein n=1 Tax=Amborella trichopoda TaxID=13333 RepID=W1NM72_AMBTC|nr:hypothetical protein AMTR_s00001p00205350 [Amborella trichopoda]
MRDAPVVDEPLLFEQVLFFKIMGADWGPFDPFLLSPSCLFSPAPRGTLLDPALAGVLWSRSGLTARQEPDPPPIGASKHGTDLPSHLKTASPLAHPKMEPRSSNKDLVSPVKDKNSRR